MSREAFDASDLLRDAVVRRLEIIGEAPPHLRGHFGHTPGDPWREIVGMRNRLVHEYFQVDTDVVWEVAQHDLPKLIAQLEPLVPPEEGATRRDTQPSRSG